MTTRLNIQAYAPMFMTWLVSVFSKKIRVFELFGIEFYLNSSVVAIPAFLVASGTLSWGVGLYVIGIAISVILHELGHALAGRFVGNSAKEICLVACGGYTVFARTPGVTAKDAFMSIMGPLTNGLVCVLLIGLESLLGGDSFKDGIQLLIRQVFDDETALEDLPYLLVLMNLIAMVNAYMLVFNLLPAFPLDGGRIFRWLSSCFLPSRKAAFVTMVVARMLAVLIVGYGLKTNLIAEFDPFAFAMSVLVGVWIWYGSQAEHWRTKLFCAAESGSREAMAEIKSIFEEADWPWKNS